MSAREEGARGPGDIEPYIRAVSIVVQGVANKWPKRPIDRLPISTFMKIEYWDAEGHQQFALTLWNARRAPSRYYFQVRDGVRKWYLRGGSVLGYGAEAQPFVEVSQKDVDKQLSAAITAPYVVERVGDAAIRHARTLVAKMLGESEIDRITDLLGMRG